VTQDMRTVIQPKSDQLNADDFVAGPRTVRITGVEIKGGEQPVSVHFEGDNGKPWKPSKSMRRALIMVFGEGDNGKSWAGRSVTLFRNPDLKFNTCIGGIQFSHASGLSAPITFALTMNRGRSVIYTVKPLETFTAELAKLTACTSLDELKSAWSAISPSARNFLKSHQESLKSKLTTTV